jgi:flagellar biosynthesis/type III secretory pathway M-ring protein FliF/YscJ
MKNKKGFISVLISVIVALAIIIGGYFLWQKITMKNLQKTTEKAAEEAGIEIETPNDNSPQGQVDAVRDMIGKVQDKENAKIKEDLEK